MPRRGFIVVVAFIIMLEWYSVSCMSRGIFLFGFVIVILIFFLLR